MSEEQADLKCSGEEAQKNKKESLKSAQQAKWAADEMLHDTNALAERVKTLEVARRCEGADHRVLALGGQGKEVRRAKLMEEQRRFWDASSLQKPMNASAPFLLGRASRCGTRRRRRPRRPSR